MLQIKNRLIKSSVSSWHLGIENSKSHISLCRFHTASQFKGFWCLGLWHILLLGLITFPVTFAFFLERKCIWGTLIIRMTFGQCFLTSITLFLEDTGYPTAELHCLIYFWSATTTVLLTSGRQGFIAVHSSLQEGRDDSGAHLAVEVSPDSHLWCHHWQLLCDKACGCWWLLKRNLISR